MRAAIVAFLLPFAVYAAEREREPRAARHYILEPQHVLSDSERATLAEQGVDVQRGLPQGRYLVRVAADATFDESDPRVRALSPLTVDAKLHRSAYRAAADGFAFARLKVFFHDDVAIDDAIESVTSAGGSVDRSLALEFGPLHSLAVQLPSDALQQFAADERVLVVYGDLPLQATTYNATAAALSKVDAIQVAPYNLTGKDVILAYFELAPPDATHKEFDGRVTVHFQCNGANDAQCNSVSNQQHATHVAGTMVAKGLNPAAKGMAPDATLHQYRANADWLTLKETGLKALGSVADNNSWGFIRGWCGSNCTGRTGFTWTGNEEYIGGYDGTLSAVLDHAAIRNDTLMLYAAGNEADTEVGPKSAPNQHNHVDGNGRPTEDIYCYSQDNSGTDCPLIKSFGLELCSTNVAFCEKARHPKLGPYGSVGWMASIKNAMTVGATTGSTQIATFSSRGPTRDGRVKPDVTAKGDPLLSTFPENTYSNLSGTSMATPTVAGTMALFTQLWRNTISNPTARPNPVMLKAITLAGADDLGVAGPDVIYGYGFLNAKASADLIIADGGVGKRIKLDSAAQGAQFDYPLTVGAGQNIRAVLSWFDPETLTPGTDELTSPVLVNDLDLKIVGPDGSTTLPYMLVSNDPCYANDGTVCKAAVKQVNTVDNNEEVEIKGAAAGLYHVVVTGKRVLQSSPQPFVIATTAGDFAPNAPPCVDVTEPNETSETAYGPLTLNTKVNAAICSDTDVDNFRFTTNGIGAVNVTLGTVDTPLTVTISGPGVTTFTKTLTANSNNGFGTLTTTASPSLVNIEVKANGTRGATGVYSITVTYPFQAPPKRHGARH